jgi:hypothetical protein
MMVKSFAFSCKFFIVEVTCTAEIARLQNSLQHLRTTQETLRGYINSPQELPPDPEFTNALKENELVMSVIVRVRKRMIT